MARLPKAPAASRAHAAMGLAMGHAMSAVHAIHLVDEPVRCLDNSLHALAALPVELEAVMEEPGGCT